MFARRSSSACRAPARNSCNDSADGTKFSEQTGKISYVDGDKPYAVGRNIRKSGDLLIGKKAVQERQQNVQDRRSSEVFSEALTGRERKGRASQHGTNLQLLSFCRRLYVHNLGQGHMIEVPASFVRTHEMQFQDAVELQGIHQESPVRTVTCHWVRSGEQQLRLYFKGGWRNFAKENGLIKGQELQFSLTSKSFFVVRVVCGTSN
ncbi:hypothetical protein M758_4G040900 [Ceratodon purpureus]|nr:hypothetical protein M758_4G040900 [Ceratodon purpureus]